MIPTLLRNATEILRLVARQQENWAPSAWPWDLALFGTNLRVLVLLDEEVEDLEEVAKTG